MKKIVFIIVALVATLAVSARVTTKTFDAPANVTAWGLASDTLGKSKADTLVLKLTSETVGKAKLLLYTTTVSGTPAYTAVLSGSINQVSYVPLDTITTTGGGTDANYFDTQDLIYNYYRIIITATSAAQKARLYLYGITRK